MKRLGLFDDIWWKLVSLGAAILLWLTISGAQEVTTAISAPIQYRNIVNNLEISSEMVEGVHLHLRGPALELSRLKPESVPIVIDLAQVTGPGERTFSIDSTTVRLPAGLTLERAVPSQVRLRFELRAAREVPVEVRTVGLKPGWTIASVECTPPTLRVMGPASRVERLQKVESDPVDLAQPQDAVVEKEVLVYAGDPQVSFTQGARVRVRIRLEHQ